MPLFQPRHLLATGLLGTALLSTLAVYLQVRDDFIATAGEEMRRLMSGAAQLRVPLRVDVGVGANWDQAH